MKEKEEELEKASLSDEPEFRTIMGRNVLNTINFYRSRHVDKNELFAPGRMAYVIELEDENAESDIPTTLIRSKADVPVTEAEMQTLTTNDIVINKLSQILSYLRQGGRGKKNKKRDKDKPLLKEPSEQRERADRDQGRDRDHDRYDRESDDKYRSKNVSIYDDVGEYRPSRRSGEQSASSNRGHEKGGSSKGSAGDKQPRQYFDKSSEQEEREAGRGAGMLTHEFSYKHLYGLLVHSF